MFEDSESHPFLGALKLRRKLIAGVFFGALALCGAAAFFTLQYSATAVVALNPAVQDQQPRSPVELAWSLLPDKQIQTLIDQFHPDSGIARLFAHGQTFTYIRSNILVHQLDSTGNAPQQVALTFSSFDRSTAIGLADALAQSVTDPNSTGQLASLPGGASLDAELEKSRKTLQLLSAGQNTGAMKAEIERRFQVDSDLKEDEQDIEYKLSELDQQQKQAALTVSRNYVAPPRKIIQDPAKIALQQQLFIAENRLVELRERYTDQYPDVVDARNVVAALQARLSRMPPDKLAAPAEKPGLSPQQEASFAAQRAALEDAQTEVENKIQDNQKMAEPLRERIADGKSFAQDYALELAHYNALLKSQQPGAVSLPGGAPLFTVVQSATSADVEGLALKPLFWIASVAGAFLLAIIVAYFAELIAPAEEERRA